eukprot:TRINITY_DN10635_c0_g1_i1.p1 TRINITY_DN10635_c0_g1~~TRINITY_DN10635_c0_g1_i1.p1  ORF type:complete len:210 (+),score=43.42 TRINITY_DN10635_c0_g1_i1:129-758(+)
MNNFVKLVLLGESGSGKTAILDRFVNKRFGTFKSTIGADFLTQEIEIDRKMVTLQIWDTAGQERFNSLSRVFYRGADCCLLVCDLTRSKTLQDVDFWRKQFLSHEDMLENADDFPFLLLANRSDLVAQREIQPDDLSSWSKAHDDIKFLETSAKNGQNVDRAFRMIVTEVMNRMSSQDSTSSAPEVKGVNLEDIPDNVADEGDTPCCGK